MLKMTSGRPLLTFTYLRSLSELQPFFNTLCLANQTDNLMLAAKQLVPKTAGNQSMVLTNGHSGPSQRPSSGYLEVKDTSGRGMSKSKSFPSFPSVQQVKTEVSAASESKTSKQFIEEVLLRDFLEPMS